MAFPPIQNCRFLIGPTGSGKTAAGVELAQRDGWLTAIGASVTLNWAGLGGPRALNGLGKRGLAHAGN